MDIVDPFKTSDASADTSSGIVDPFAAPATQLKPPPSTGTRFTDYLKEPVAGAVEGIGKAISGIGSLGKLVSPIHYAGTAARAEGASPAAQKIASAASSIGDLPQDALQWIGNKITQGGQWIAGTESPGAQAAEAKPVFEGQLLHPSTWKLGEGATSPSSLALKGLGFAGAVAPMLIAPEAAGARVLGAAGRASEAAGEAVNAIRAGGALSDISPEAAQLVKPIAARAALTKKVVGTGGNALQMTEGAAQNEQVRIQQMPDDELAKLPAYQTLIAQGVDPDTARQTIAQRAHDATFAATLGPSIGMAYTSVLPLLHDSQGALSRVVGDSRLARAATGAALEAPVQGAAFTGQNAASIAAANAVTGENRSPLDDSTATFGSGALMGGLFGLAGGLHRPTPAGPLGRAADTARATGAAAPVPNPGAAPGSLSDAANVLHRTTPANPVENQPTPNTVAEAPVTRRVDPPSVPWINTETGEQRTPTATEIVAAFHGMQDQQAQAAANNVKLVTNLRQLSEAWGVPLERLKSLRNATANERAKGVTTADAQQRAAEDLAQQRATEARQQADRDLFSASAQENASPAAGDQDASAAGIPFMITNAMRADLAARGYDRDAISRMTPQEAHVALANPVPRETTEAPSAEAAVPQPPPPSEPEGDEAASATRAEPASENAAPVAAAEPAPESDIATRTEAQPQPETATEANEEALQQSKQPQTSAATAPDEKAAHAMAAASKPARSMGAAAPAQPDVEGATLEADALRPSAPAERGEPTTQTFPLRQAGPKGLVVQGIRDDVRAALRAGGFKKPGTAAKDGVRFDAIDRPAIERALGVNVAATEVDAAARESAAHPQNERPEPTPAQHEAGNFKSGHVNLHGLDVTLQVPKGGMRRGADAQGMPWEREASAHYGHIRGTEGADREPVDVYLGPHAEDPKSNVFVIDQVKPGTKTFDEHKAMIGFASGREARAAYDANFPKGVKTFGGIRKMSMDEFKDWVKSGDTTKPVTDKVTVATAKPPRSTTKAEPLPTATPGKKLGGTRTDQARYTVDHADVGKSDTTYGNASRIREPTPEDTPPDGAGRGRRDAVSNGTLELFAPQGERSAVQAARAVAPKLTQSVRLVKSGLFKSGVDRIRKWQDAAHIIAPIRKSPQEYMVAVVADADGKPLAVLRHTVGLKASSQVDPVTVAGAVAQIPDAKQVWFAHNHPSGELDQGGADRAITARLHDTLRGSGIEPRGMIVVGPGETRASFYHPEHVNDIDGSRRGGTDSAQPITAASRTAEVPMVERQFRKVAQGPRVRITDPNGMADAVRDVAHGETGVMLLDNRHHVIGFLPMSDAEMAKLRTDDPATGAARVLRTASEANASASIPVVRDIEAGQNVNRLLAGTGSVEPERQNIRPLDIAIVQPDGAVKSAASMGRRPLREESFYSRGEQSTGTPLTRDQVQKLVDTTTAKWGDNQPKVRVLADAEALPQKAKIDAEGRPDDSYKTAEGYYDPTTGTGYLIASNLKGQKRALEVLAHEAIGHHGIENVVNAAFGPDAMQKIADAIQRLDKGDRASTTMRALLDETHRRYDRDGQPPDPTTFAKEFLAVSAEKGIRNAFLDRVVTAIRKFLRQIMPHLQINERELRGLLAQGDRFVREETPYRERVAQKAAVAFSRPDDQTKAEAFRKFFGDSKVVDADGNPRPVFHGTSEGFYTFDNKHLGESTAHMTAPLGHFFAEHRGSAARYAENASRGVTADERVVDAYLNIRKPFDMTTKDLLEIDSPDEARSMKRQLQERGYDGIHVTDAKQWVAFKPEQIKSASENRGTFDRSNPDIRFSKPEPATPENPADPSREPHRAVAAIESAIQSTEAKDAWTKMAKDWLRGRFEDARPWLLKVAPLDRLVELAQEVEPLKVGATQFARSAKQMATDREHLLTGAPDAKEHPHDMLQRGVSPLAEELRAFAHGKGIGAFRGEIRPEAKRTFKLMHEATTAGVYLDGPYERLKIQNARGDRVEWTPELRKERLSLMDELAMQRGGDPDSNREKLREEKKYLRALPRLEAEHKAAYDRLKPQFDALSEEAKRNWRQTRDWFQQFRDEVEKTAIKRIERATPDEGSRRAAVEAMRLMYEEARVDGVYFPLARHGDYWIAYTTKGGKSGFEMQEDANTQHKRERQLRAAGNRVDATGLRTKNAKAKEAPSGTFVRKAMDMLAKNGVSETTRDELYQMYLQMLPEMSMRKHALHRDNVIGWSEDVPRTFADNGFHGAYQLARMRHSQDMELALEAAGIALDNWRKSNDRFPGSSAPQLERFMSDTLDRYDADPGAAQAAAAKVDSGGLALAIDDIARRIASEKTGKQARVESEVWNGLAKRWSALPDNVRRAYTLEAMQQFGLHGEHSTFDVAKADTLLGALKNNLDWVLNPEDAQWANRVTQLGFTFYLGLNPASALTNLTQIAQTTLPVLGAEHGWPKASRMVSAAWRDAARTLGHMDKTLTDPDEKRAFLLMQKRGDFSKTQGHTLAALAEGNRLRSAPAWAKVADLTSYLFHTSEVINREATGMAAFRLARSKGMDFEQALDYAGRINASTQFDYSAQNRAPIMRGNVARIAFQFKNFAIQQSFLVGRNMWLATRGETPEVRRLARRTTAGILGMTALLAGVTGLPAYNAVCMTLNAVNTLFGDDDESWNADDAFHRWLADNLSPDAARLIAEGPTNYLTGANLASRTSLSNLWIHDSNQRLEGVDAYHALLESLAGPVFGGIVPNIYTGAEDVRRGYVWRGVERMLPASVKNSMKALRYAHDGVNSLRGDPIVPDVSGYEDFLQAIGFQPAAVANQYRVNTAIKNYTGEIKDRRTTLMNAYALAVKSGDAENRVAAVAAIHKFNTAHPEVAITVKTLSASLRARARRSAQAMNGVVLDRKLALRALQYAGAQRPEGSPP